MMEKQNKKGYFMHELITTLFPICRSITGNGVRQTLKILGEEFQSLQVFEVPSGTPVFDWHIPKEWNLNEAYIIAPDGTRFCETQATNLHIVNYSTPIQAEVELEELRNHLYTLPDLPQTIPYITSYYKERWGFCLTHDEYEKLQLGKYQVYVDTTLEEGALTYGEVLIAGKSTQEVLISTYVCHPSMANNELSGPVMTTSIIQWLQSQEQLRYSYRVVFVPETIGSITYISKHLDLLKELVFTGFNINCVGDEGRFSYLPSRAGDGLADKVIQHVLSHLQPDYNRYTFLDRGSDERQYCSPGVDLKVASLMKSKFGEYPEYHSSDDNLEFVTEKGLQDCYEAYVYCLKLVENNISYKATNFCEPQMGKRGLYPTLGSPIKPIDTKRMMHILAYCDGEHDIIDIAEIIGCPAWELISLFDELNNKGLIDI